MKGLIALVLFLSSLSILSCSKVPQALTDDSGSSVAESPEASPSTTPEETTPAATVTPSTYLIGGTVTGLVGTLVLQNNGADNLSIASTGAFAFSTGMATGASYAVTVLSSPTGQTCSISSGSGTVAAAAVSSVSVSCVSTFHAYVGSYDGMDGHLYSCSVNSTTGALSSCTLGDGGATLSPGHISVKEISGVSRAYIPSLDGSIYVCSLNATTGAVNACAVSNGGVNWGGAGNPASISFASVGGVTRAYVASAGDVYLCSLNANGTLASCAASGLTTAYQVSIVAVGNNSYAYFAGNNAHIYRCAVNASTGAVGSCTQNDGGVVYGSTQSITVASVGGAYYAYVTDAAHAYLCAVNSGTGALSGCAISDGGVGTWQPVSVAIVNVNGALRVYVAASDNHVYVCSISSVSGVLSGCAINDGGVSSGAWAPSSIVVPSF